MRVGAWSKDKPRLGPGVRVIGHWLLSNWPSPRVNPLTEGFSTMGTGAAHGLLAGGTQPKPGTLCDICWDDRQAEVLAVAVVGGIPMCADCRQGSWKLTSGGGKVATDDTEDGDMGKAQTHRHANKVGDRPDRAEVMRLFEQDGLKVKEIATQLGCTSNQVSYILNTRKKYAGKQAPARKESKVSKVSVPLSRDSVINLSLTPQELDNFLITWVRSVPIEGKVELLKRFMRDGMENVYP